MWTIPKHCKDIKQYKKTLDLFKAKKGEEIDELGREEIMKGLEEWGVFKPRKENTYNKATYGHKILDPHFYGMLYRGKCNGKVHISANGDLLSKYWDDFEKRRKIFLSMIMNIQFPNPAKPKVPADVRIYPYRLIFELITEEKLDNYLTTDEIANILYRVKKVETEEEKEEVIQSVILYRAKNRLDKNIELQKEADSYVRAEKSLDYTLSVLESIGLTERVKTEDVFEIKRKENVKQKEEKIKSKKVIMKNEIVEFYKKLQSKRKATDPIVEKTMYSEWVRQLYNNIADELIEELGSENLNISLMQLPQKLISASKESDNWQKFEDVLVDAYNVFDDLRSKKIGVN